MVVELVIQMELILKIGKRVKDSLKKKISAPGFRLSGSGWYETDFKSKNQKNLSKGDNADNGSSTKSDKPASGGSAKPGGKEAAA